jgi:hypothetical protein
MTSHLLSIPGLLLVLLLTSCRGPCPAPAGEDKPSHADMCGVIARQNRDAEQMRGMAIAAYKTAADELEMGRKWSSGEVTSENRVGKYSTAERRGWQNAYAGATWCRAAEMLHGQIIANANLLGDANLAEAVTTRNVRDCSLDLFSRLLVDELERAKEFITDAEELNRGKSKLELALIERCPQVAATE